MENTKVFGLILAGGRSSRMGYDKSKIEYHHKPQIVFINDLLLNHCEKVFLSTNKENSETSLIIDSLPDLFELKSPLNGILTAFNHHVKNAWLTIPCDMPLIDNSLILYLLQSRNKEKVATCFIDSDNQFPDPLFAIWEPKAALLLSDYYRKGGISPRKFLMNNDVAIIKSPDPQKLININTPEELTRYHQSQRKVN